MDYNTDKFTKELNDTLVSKLDNICEIQKDVLEILIGVLLSSDWNNQKDNHTVFLSLLAKIRFNVDACNQIVPSLKNDSRFKTSSNLIYRGIVDDIINIYYLLGYALFNEQKYVSLGNELSILHIEFLKSCESIIRSETEFIEYMHNLYKKEINLMSISSVETGIRNANSHLYNFNEKKWKTNKEIRKSSNSFFADLFPKEGAFITESKKIEFIKKRGLTRHPVLSYLFKYFSQYQHFSPKMHDFLLHHCEYDLDCYKIVLLEIVAVTFEVVNVINIQDKEYHLEKAMILMKTL